MFLFHLFHSGHVARMGRGGGQGGGGKERGTVFDGINIWCSNANYEKGPLIMEKLDDFQFV